MARFVQVFSLGLTFLAFVPSAHADEAQREALALEVMILTGMSDVGNQAAAGLVSHIQPAFPTVPDALWLEITESVPSEEFLELAKPPFVKHFTQAELAAMVEFYTSPHGKAVLEKMPAVQYETMVIGNEWAQRKRTEILEKLKAAGYEPQGM